MNRRRLHRRYGRSAVGRTTVMVLTRGLSIGDGPGPVHTTFATGDLVEVGGPAGNRDYLIAYRVRKPGIGWARLGPHAVVPKNALTEVRW